MFISILPIDVGDNPDRPRPGRLWLCNMYNVHRRLCMAFPTEELKSEDPDFLKPYDPNGFKHVQKARTPDTAFLFRLDPQPGGMAVILVQSAIKPDWDYAFHNADYLVKYSPEVRPYDPRFGAGDKLRFKLAANPVRKASQRSLDADGNPLDKRWIGKRVPVPADKLEEWLERRAENKWSAPSNSADKQAAPGFRILDISNIQPGYVYVNKKSGANGRGLQIRSARYEGTLEVTEPDHFKNTLIKGIGPAKAFGFGLMSVARA